MYGSKLREFMCQSQQIAYKNSRTVNTLCPACKTETRKEESGWEFSHIQKFGATSVSECDILKISKRRLLSFTALNSLVQ